MAFLDNAGDIILDAVLTDTGRMLLAKGDGSFRITKFAFGDDEINYELFNAGHASGSAYYDLEILQTPVLEAFTNNTSSLKSKLITLSNNRLSLLPVIRLNQDTGVNGAGSLYGAFSKLAGDTSPDGSYWVLADSNTATGFGDNATGKLHSYGTTYPSGNNKPIYVDQGLATSTEGTENLSVGNDLYETQYLVEVDNRFLEIYSNDGTIAAPKSFVDDDNVASYFMALQGSVADSKHFKEIAVNEGVIANSPLEGRPGSRFGFKLKVSTNIENGAGASNYLFQTFGNAVAAADLSDSSDDYRVIDTMVRVTGFTTGYRVDIPIKIIKKDS
jgi:hypothetical protein